MRSEATQKRVGEIAGKIYPLAKDYSIEDKVFPPQQRQKGILTEELTMEWAGWLDIHHHLQHPHHAKIVIAEKRDSRRLAAPSETAAPIAIDFRAVVTSTVLLLLILLVLLALFYHLSTLPG